MPELSSEEWDVDVLGYPETAGYSGTAPVSFKAYQVADGETIFRQERTVGPKVVSCTCYMDESRFQYFEGWFYHSLKQGALWFEMPIQAGRGLIVFDVHFTAEGYAWNYLGGRRAWEVTFTVEYAYSRTTDNEPIPPGLLIVAGHADNPSVDGEIRAGTEDNPATDGVIDANSAQVA